MAVSAGITRGSQYIIKSKVQTGNKIFFLSPSVQDCKLNSSRLGKREPCDFSALP
jgi:hypothetical protein